MTVKEASKACDMYLSTAFKCLRRRKKRKLNDAITEYLLEITVKRDYEAGHNVIVKHYFDAHERTYDKTVLRRRFRMMRSLFIKIVNEVQEQDSYFIRKPNYTGKLGLSVLQKVVAAILQLAYGLPANAIEECVKIGETMALEFLTRFCDAIDARYVSEYLHKSTEADLKILLEENSVASYDLWIWHAFFWTPGTLNDINVIDRSPLFNSLVDGRSTEVNYAVNGRLYNIGYYLTDGIYPKYATLIQAIPNPHNEKAKGRFKCTR
ncbi:hypothetical protein [Parasitella parasitica]|uniref:Uncharacterized protein n=1 Tax=Parasitella parasitica TaxID=35722 RepID=A0A0B7NXC7_9FUNG|nr:hypothetical protein [Parasitella parasitica]